MCRSRSLRTLLWIGPLLAFGLISCSKSDTATAPGAIASLSVHAPDSATSGQSFTVGVDASAHGINNVRNAHVNVTVPAPMTVTAVGASGGETAAFNSNSASWDIGILDSNTNSHLSITIVGTLPPGSPVQAMAITASMTADGINAGDAVASDTVQINP